MVAAVSAVVVLVTCVMPAEYAIDPTGVGKVLGLTKEHQEDIALICCFEEIRGFSPHRHKQ